MIGDIFAIVFILVEISIGLDSFQSNHAGISRVIDIWTVGVIGQVDLW
jgi:hypothetical protein